MKQEPPAEAKERMDPDVDRGSLILAEHMVRYQFAASFVAGRSVVDVACGSGYGCRLLLEAGVSSVLGVDYSAEAVERSRQLCSSNRFVRADGHRLPIRDGSFEVAVSFETIEHVHEPKKLLSELKRVLVPDGLLIISSPNRSVYPEGNPYHLTEYEFEEFRDLLSVEFGNVRMLSQDNWISSTILTEALTEDASSPAIDSRLSKTSGRTPGQCLYALALCSDGPIPEAAPHAALSRVSDNDFWLEEMARRDAELTNLHAVREERQRQFEVELHEVQQVVEDKQDEINRLSYSVQVAANHRSALQKQLQEATDRLSSMEALFATDQDRLRLERDAAVHALNEIHGSTAWRLLGNYRQAVRKTPAGGRVYSLVRGLLSAGFNRRADQDVQPQEEIEQATDRPELRLPAFADPLVSIVIPVHDHVNMTRSCLESILRHTHGVAYEVIVVDDGSTDQTARFCSQVANLRVVTNESALGFLRATNAGAAEASGDYLVLLNNDTEVRPNWLNALLEPVETDRRVAMVGAKLLYPDLSLQEAGSIVWSDGTGYNYGRGKDPGACEFNYLREVDYCSAACLLVRRDLFEEAGRFDERYAPAYYEDTDLAFTLRSKGYKVLYQYRSEVIHHEGASNGTDESAGIKRFQEINRTKFVDKWAGALAEQPPPGSNLIRARERSREHRILVIDATVPTFDHDSGSLRMNSLLLGLVERGYSVTLLPDNRDPRQPYTSRLQSVGVEVLYGDYDLSEWLKVVAPQLRMCLASRPSVAWRYLAALREYAPECPFVFDTVDLHYLRETRRAESEGKDWLFRLAQGYKELELGLVRSADATLTVTDRERNMLLAEVPEAAVYVVPNVHEVRAVTRPFGQRKDLLFVGGFNHPPNQPAVEYFVHEVLPLVKQQLPDVHLHVVGSFPPQEVKDLESPDVTIAGYVPDLAPYLDGCRLSVAPLTYGAGLKGKITQTLSEGLPVVTTSIGVEGTSLRHGHDVMVADDPEGFAEALVRAYTDEELWSALSANGLAYAQEHFSVVAVRRLLDDVLVDLKVPEPAA